MVGPQAKREAVHHLVQVKALRPHRACQLVGLSSSTYHYQSYSSKDDEALKAKLKSLARESTQWGFPRLLVLLKREGFMDNHKRVHRFYTELNLQVQKRPKKQKKSHLRLVLPQAEKPNHIWSMDFVHDQLFDGRRFKCFNLVDEFTHESLLIKVDRSIKAINLVEYFNELKIKRPLPEMIVCDNGPELTSQVLDIWAYQNNVKLKFIQPGKPTQNAFVESFNGKFRDECLNQHWFLNLDHARKEIEAWRKDYNEYRPHRSLNMKTPNEFAKEYKEMLVN